MKKLLLILTFIVGTFCLKAQLEPVYAYMVFIGETNTLSTTWSGGEECDILIEIGKTNLIIHSKKEQVYRILKSIEHTEKRHKWAAIDDDGIRCHISVGYSDGFNSTYIMIEYSDISIVYLTTSR